MYTMLVIIMVSHFYFVPFTCACMSASHNAYMYKHILYDIEEYQLSIFIHQRYFPFDIGDTELERVRYCSGITWCLLVHGFVCLQLMPIVTAGIIFFSHFILSNNDGGVARRRLTAVHFEFDWNRWFCSDSNIHKTQYILCSNNCHWMILNTMNFAKEWKTDLLKYTRGQLVL